MTVSDTVDVSSNSLVFDELTQLGFTQDLDAFHQLANGNALFSSDTFIFGLPDVGTVNPGDVIEWDGSNFSLFFDSNNFVGAGNVDAITILGNGHLLLSTKGNSNLPGIGAFLDGDIVEWDGATGSLLLGEASIFTSGANNSVDALHSLGGSLIFSPGTDGAGGLGSNGLAYGMDSSDLFEIQLGTGATSRFLDGENLSDSNNTRQTDAAFLGSAPENLPVFGPAGLCLLAAALGVLGAARVHRRQRG